MRAMQPRGVVYGTDSVTNGEFVALARIGQLVLPNDVAALTGQPTRAFGMSNPMATIPRKSRSSFQHLRTTTWSA